MSRSGLSRADLIRCVEALPAERFTRVAAALGYREQPAEPREQRRRGKRGGQAAGGTDTGTAPRAPTTARLHRQFAVTQHTRLKPETPPIQPPKPVPAAEPPAPPLGPPPPLLPWARLWPFLRAALGEQAARGRLDLPRLVDALSRGRPLRRLPQLRCRRWAPQGQLLLDLHPRLYPFWDDFNALIEAILRLRGASGLEIIRVDQGIAAPVQRWQHGQWSEPLAWTPPPAGTPVVIAGDLGWLGTAADRHGWLLCARRLAALDIVPVLLTPCPPRQWDPAFAGLVFPVALDRRCHLPPAPRGPRPWPAAAAGPDALATDAGASLLLSLLGACIQITPALLRHLRHALPADRADAGSEAAAWCHPAFRAGDFALMPGDPVAIEAIRADHARHSPAERAIAWQLIRADHADASLAVQMEERALHAALEGRCDEAAEAFLDRVDGALQQAQTAGGEHARFLAGWVNRRSRRLPPEAWALSPRSEGLWLRANPQAREGEAVLPAGLNLHRGLDGLGVAREIPRLWPIVQRGESFEFAPPVIFDIREIESGSMLQRVTAGRQLVQAEDLGTGQQIVRSTVDDGMKLPLNDAGWRIETDSEMVTIEPILRPSWAHTIGRDYPGLFVEFGEGAGLRRLYWQGPGPVDCIGIDGQWIGDVELEQGRFVDARQYLRWWQSDFDLPDWAEHPGIDEFGLFADLRVKNVVQRFRWIWPGQFRMGSPEHEHDRLNIEVPHQVVLTRGYWLADTACTQALWQAVMGTNPSRFKGQRRPVEMVSWDEVQTFIGRLNERVAGLGARLPTEAEWEYACRAGTTGPFSFGDDTTPEQVNYSGEYPYRGRKKGLYREQTVEVASLPPNQWGLYEMHGNVWEWCADGYGDYPAGTAIDPTGPPAGERRVLRGGSWIRVGRRVRSACRNHDEPGLRFGDYGFRLTLGPELRQEPLRGGG